MAAELWPAQWAELVFRGKAAHGSRPDEGRDAIMDAAAFLGALEAFGTELTLRMPHPLLVHGSLSYFPIQKDEKISPRMVSTSMRPVSESSARIAVLTLSAASSGVKIISSIS